MSSLERVRDAIRSSGSNFEVQVLPDSTKTAADAAAALGCTVGQIAKSIIFESVPSGSPVLVVASGANRVDEKAVSDIVGEQIKKASAEFVQEKTGFAIGGVSPFGSLTPLTILFDEDLFTFEEIWAAAGSPHAVFRASPAELQRAVSASPASVAVKK